MGPGRNGGTALIHGFGSRLPFCFLVIFGIFLFCLGSLVSTSCHLSMCGGIVDPGLPGFPYKPALPSNGIFTGIKYSHPFLNGSIGSFFKITSTLYSTPHYVSYLLSTTVDYILT